jgi:hypothetical protein
MFAGTERYDPIKKDTNISTSITPSHVTLCFSKKETRTLNRRIVLIELTMKNRNIGTNRKIHEMAL